MRSYKPEEPFEIDGSPASDIPEFVPKADLRLGMLDDVIGGRVRRPMDLPDASIVAVPCDRPGAPTPVRSTRLGADPRRGDAERTEEDRNFRIFCPDELEFQQAGGGARGDRACAHLVRRGRQPLRAGRARRRGSRRASRRGLPRGLPQRPAGTPCSRATRRSSRSSTRRSRSTPNASRCRTRFRGACPSGRSTILLTSDALAPGPQWLSHQSPGFINSLLNRKGHGPADHAAARCEHAERDRRPLPALDRLHQPRNAQVADDGQLTLV